MKATAKSFDFLGEFKKFSVPFFQRRYVWKKENWEEFLASLESDIMPFIGSIIVKWLPQESEVIIIDGQQRLTTLTIMIKALFDAVSPEYKTATSGVRRKTEAYLFYTKNAADDFSKSRVKIQHSRADIEPYEIVMWAGFLGKPLVDLDNIDNQSSQILKCYKYYRERFQNYSDDQLIELFNTIFSDERKVLVLIQLEHNDINEQQIFDTINRAGVKLTISDIIKNNLFKTCLDVCEAAGRSADDVYYLYDTYWDKVFSLDDIIRAEWDEERSFGNVKRTNLEFLLYCIAVIKWGKSKETFNDLEGCYSRNLKNKTYDELYDFILEIKEYADLFKKYIIDFHNSFSLEGDSKYFSYSNHVYRLFLVLEMFGVQMFYPYVLKEIKQVSNNLSDSELIRKFKILSSFVVRRRLSGRGVSDYAIKCDQIIHEKSIEDVLVSEMVSAHGGINNRDIESFLKGTIANDTARTILFCIELYKRYVLSVDVQELSYTYTLEHIMPKKWTNCWNSVPVLDEDNNIITDDEVRASIRASHILNIGNMTLLTRKLNSKVSNRSFEDKIKGIKDKNGKSIFGYSQSSTMLLTKDIIQSFNDGQYIWDEKRIEERCDDLTKDILKIWPDYREYSNSQEISSEDATDDSEERSIDLNKISTKALSNPIELLGEINELSTNTNEDDSKMYSLTEFVQKVTVQKSAIISKIKEGTIIPDKEIAVRNLDKRYAFTEKNITQSAKRFGWEIINEENIYKIFFEYINTMTMSQSYKPVFLKGLLELSDNNGSTKVSDIVMYFLNYYSDRSSNNLTREKKNCVMAKVDCTYEEAEKILFTYPYDVFSKMGIVDYSEEDQLVNINPYLWKTIKNEKAKIKNICDEKLLKYYMSL